MNDLTIFMRDMLVTLSNESQDFFISFLQALKENINQEKNINVKETLSAFYGDASKVYELRFGCEVD